MVQMRVRRIHFVGIGGIGMSGIAEVLFNQGYRVSGSDLKASDTTEHLAALGLAVHVGHDAAHVADADVVVISSAVRGGNPEVEAARARKIPVIRRAEMLAELMRLKHGIAVAGTHGKTTVTSLIASILEEAELDPTVVVGGRLNATGRNAMLGKGEFLVAEADESDGSFLRLSPTFAVVTNIDPEHMDYFADMDEVRMAYLNFLNKVPFYGVNVVCLDHPELQAMLPRLERRVLTYGTSIQADLQANDIVLEEGKTSYEMLWKGQSLGRFSLGLLGHHNVLNSLAAAAIAFELQVSPERVRAAFAKFAGIQRRFQLWGEVNDIMVVDDYAHHPVEIQATLLGARASYAQRRIVAVFQPHRYSRLRDLFQDFVTSFYQCDQLWVTDIYAAGEVPLEGIHARTFVDAIRQHGHRDVHYVADLNTLKRKLLHDLQPSDLLITLGAGNVWTLARDVVQALKDEQAQRLT
ncbi:MAG: UDP-N-acetylmuramate--L-alanine ligase [Myxococcota bacterium]